MSGLLNDFSDRAKSIVDNRLNRFTQRIENKLENAVEDLFSKALKKIGLSDQIAQELSSRFGDSLTSGLSDDYFRSFTPEMNRATPEEIVNNFSPVATARDRAQTYTDAIVRASNRTVVDGLPTLQFPNHLGKYYMTMKFKQYQRPAPEARGTLEFKQAFALPIPRTLREAFDIKVGEQDQGSFGGIADVATKYLNSTEGDRGTEAIKGAALAVAYSTLVQKADAATGGLVGQVTGAVANPHVQAIFSGVPLRTHRFDWIFAPRNAQESDNLLQLLKALKAYSLPSYSSIGTAALAYPFLCQVELHPNMAGDFDDTIEGARDSVHLMKFAPCLIQNVEINYSPQGLPAFNVSGPISRPAVIEVGITMLETEIQTAERYGRRGGDRVAEMWDQLVDSIENVTGLDIQQGLDDVASGLANGLGLNDSNTNQTQERNPNQEPDRANTDNPVSGGDAAKTFYETVGANTPSPLTDNSTPG